MQIIYFSRKFQTNRPKDGKHVDTALLTRNKKGRGKNNWREKRRRRSIGNAIRNNILFGCYMYQKGSTRFLTDAQASKSHDRDWIVETTKRTQKILHHMIQQIVMDHIEDESMVSFKLRFTKINKQNSVWRHDCMCQLLPPPKRYPKEDPPPGAAWTLVEGRSWTKKQSS